MSLRQLSTFGGKAVGVAWHNKTSVRREERLGKDRRNILAPRVVAIPTVILRGREEIQWTFVLSAVNLS
jgi:hypothetical protein